MDRKNLIALSLKYEGDYDKIIKAISNKTPIEQEFLDAADKCDAITIYDATYPKKLLGLRTPPMVLFYKGNLDLLKGTLIGVAGSRVPSDYATRATRDLSSNCKYPIISGLAKGIDATAHKYSNASIGIIGCGIDYIYPECNSDLFRKLEQTGLILSEYPGYTKPFSPHFPMRNRIIAALSDTLYIMEASAPKCGTMTTFSTALDLGIDTKVLPFDAYADCYNNTLIAEGAMVITKEDLGV